MAGRWTWVVALALLPGLTNAARASSPVLHGSALAARAGHTITIGPAANAKTIRLRRGDTLVVRLPGNMTTGYRWSVSRIPACLRLTASSYVPSPPMRPGQGGTFVFRFKVGSGSGTLRLAYRRPWETSIRPLRTFAVTVRAR